MFDGLGNNNDGRADEIFEFKFADLLHANEPGLSYSLYPNLRCGAAQAHGSPRGIWGKENLDPRPGTLHSDCVGSGTHGHMR